MLRRMRDWQRMGIAAAAPLVLAGQGFAQEETPKVTKTMTVVVSSDQDDTEGLLNRVREQLKNSGVPEEKQEQILKQVREAMEKATVAKKEWTEAGKAAAEAGKAAAEVAKESATIVIRAEAAKAGEELAKGKQRLEKELRVQGLKLEELRSKLPKIIEGRVLQGMKEAGPNYRIGISISQSESEGEDKADAEEATVEVSGLVVEDVMEDSPASEAGVKPGDVVLSVNGEKVKVFTQLQEAVQVAGKKEQPVVLLLNRDGEETKVLVKPAKTDDSDVGVMDLKLMPHETMVFGQGFVFGDGKDGSKEIRMMPAPNAATWTVTSNDESSVKKEIQELKSEVAELKAMIQKLLEK
jgi:membrane-associated protease RseP (regulator of RpoE activity)